MIAKHMITDGVIPLKTSDSARTALSWMEDLRVMHVPIVNETSFLGLVSEFDVYDYKDFDEPLGNIELSLNAPYIFDDQHIFDALKVMHAYKLSLIPVLDEHHNYLGCITLQSLLEHFASSFAVAEPGGVIVMEVSARDFVLSEIARIVESNDAKILSMFTQTDANSSQLQLSLKLNRIDIEPILQTFNRFQYNIVASFSERTDQDDLRDRFDSLMNYLNI
ncbi:MAG: CBS domain-containing protein [Bacteroidetes bacterium]|jgi:acetoin utilization protein AcuB|nr:CBS domain-containing protein [Bacteroidota bacterium]MBU1580374.1 CBS domain-containing protein [Bacteroidota bacterium]MBU2559120.1 CBS domain-containing protein [Bacteroidota bacterium]MDA3944546.1 CBS domain-containing protein [Bacteroidota bacterium]